MSWFEGFNDNILQTTKTAVVTVSHILVYIKLFKTTKCSRYKGCFNANRYLGEPVIQVTSFSYVADCCILGYISLVWLGSVVTNTVTRGGIHAFHKFS